MLGHPSITPRNALVMNDLLARLGAGKLASKKGREGTLEAYMQVAC